MAVENKTFRAASMALAIIAGHATVEHAMGAEAVSAAAQP
jgi:hypothetical protein